MRKIQVFLALTLILSLLAPVCLAEGVVDPAIAALETRVGVTVADAEAKYKEIKKGSGGDVVRAAQTKLIELGYLDDRADGSFGGKTDTAVQLFETEQDLIVDGVLSPIELYYLLDCAPLTRTEVTVSKANANDLGSVKAALAVLPIRVSESKVLVQSKLNKETYPDMLNALIVNNSDKTIVSYTVGFLAFDENGNAVQILTQYDENGYYEILGDAEGIDAVAPGQTYGATYGWRLQENHGIGYLLACVKSATFEDGTTWDNPIYAIWKEAYAEKSMDVADLAA